MELDAEGKPKLSEEDINILQAFHAMHLKPPKIEKPEDLMSYMKHIVVVYNKEATVTTPSAANTATTTAAPDVKPSKDLGAIPNTGSHHYPKLSIFYGEANKGDVIWQGFKFE
ncbi:hypothetical protein DPMN_162531 [Dreissena polymorpha]|uniref:Uncharacterized protein n=1 Tax=Dreissena polymorpha TaxID=45954 RepID=A0A9D4EQL2_DREPO|nr:hypothetical protein DPMN_162531 [Dreissena polymorpha]